MHDDRFNEAARRAMQAGRGALEGLKAAHGHARIARLLPGVGPAIQVAILAAGAITGAVRGLGDLDEPEYVK